MFASGRREAIEARPTVVRRDAPLPAIQLRSSSRWSAPCSTSRASSDVCGVARATPCPCSGPKIKVRRIIRSSVPCSRSSRSSSRWVDMSPECMACSGEMSTRHHIQKSCSRARHRRRRDGSDVHRPVCVPVISKRWLLRSDSNQQILRLEGDSGRVAACCRTMLRDYSDGGVRGYVTVLD